ncbi:MAG TPA: hypothetical protein VFJ58_18430 [Armatimonadota bacterium]|nr:hypothetical protein [Armatimonadota bacterium]
MISIHAEHHDAGRRVYGFDPSDQIQPTRALHLNVNEHAIRLQGQHSVKKLVSTTGFAYHLNVWLLRQEPPKASPHEAVIISNQHS